jgi:hypothetical protein
MNGVLHEKIFFFHVGSFYRFINPVGNAVHRYQAGDTHDKKNQKNTKRNRKISEAGFLTKMIEVEHELSVSTNLLFSVSIVNTLKGEVCNNYHKASISGRRGF